MRATPEVWQGGAAAFNPGKSSAFPWYYVPPLIFAGGNKQTRHSPYVDSADRKYIASGKNPLQCGVPRKRPVGFITGL